MSEEELETAIDDAAAEPEVEPEEGLDVWPEEFAGPESEAPFPYPTDEDSEVAP